MLRSNVSWDAIWRLLRDGAGQRGFAKRGPTGATWDVSGDCEEPATLELRSSSDRIASRRYGVRIGLMLYLEMRVRCRRCANCMRQRRKQWIARTIPEVRSAKRAWFATLTFNEQVYLPAVYAAQLRVGAAAWAMLSERQRDAELHRELGKQITLFLKRVRKGGLYPGGRQEPASLRYIVVGERGDQTGRWHYHMLLLEQDIPVRQHFLAQQWARCGFSRWKLVDDTDAGKAAAYVCAYINKTLTVRVRASQRFGRSVGLPMADQQTEIDPVWSGLLRLTEPRSPGEESSEATDPQCNVFKRPPCGGSVSLSNTIGSAPRSLQDATASDGAATRASAPAQRADSTGERQCPTAGERQPRSWIKYERVPRAPPQSARRTALL